MTEEQFNPFSPEQAPGVQVVILMRIYDVLMALLQVQDEETHDKLDALHESGQIVWSLPTLNLSADNAATTSSEEVGDKPVPPTEPRAPEEQYMLDG